MVIFFLAFRKRKFQIFLIDREFRGIQDWNKLKNKFIGLEEEEFELPSWQINELNDRMAEYERNPSNTTSFQEAIVELEKEL